MGNVENSTAISIQWDRLSCIEQNSDITGYVLQVTSADEIMNISINVTQMGSIEFTVMDLSPFTKYSFEVAAVNSDGEIGPYSKPLTLETPPDGELVM